MKSKGKKPTGKLNSRITNRQGKDIGPNPTYRIPAPPPKKKKK